MNSGQTERFLATLKDFQRDTVDYAFRRMYEETPPSTRFLIADEVGLGKTIVAAGIVARATDLLLHTDPGRRVDVVYICSNSGIARQNIKRLNKIGGPAHDLPDRITMLPRYTKQLREQKNRVNFIAFSPGTSFNLRSSGGRSEERALLYHLVPDHWRAGNEKGAVAVLMGDMRRDRFQYQIDSIDPRTHIDDSLTAEFQSQLSQPGTSGDGSAPTLKARFVELAAQLRGRSNGGLSDDERAQRLAIVGELRSTLAAVCVRSLEPDIVILDEFQRFTNVMRGEEEAGRLARTLFQYRDDKFQDGHVRVLLLSATPYRMFSTADDAGTDDHYKDLIQTVGFLQQDASATTKFEKALGAYRQGLYRLPVDSGVDLRVARDAVQSALSRVMVRTERLGVTTDRSGMLREVPTERAVLSARDVAAYLEVQALARAIEVPDIVEYWKSAPYLLNFMEEYDLKRELADRIRAGGKEGLQLPVPSHESGALLSKADVEAYRQIDPGNARLRALMHDMVESGAWQMLWVPPSWHYYAPEGAFANPALQRFTKRLIFSSWQVVPKVVASLLTHETERLMLGLGPEGSESAQTPEARKKRAGRLRFAVSDKRPTGMPILALLYPSIALARACDPHQWAQTGSGGAPPTLASVMSRAEHACAAMLADITPDAPTIGEIDQRWYWAAPLLLDQTADPEAQKAWLGQKNLAGLWRAAGDAAIEDEEDFRAERESDSAWQEHVQLARSIVANPKVLERVPEDLPRVLALLALAGPGVVALRALARVSGGISRYGDPLLRNSAGQVAEGFRSLFNRPEVGVMVRDDDAHYWRRVLEYCAQGGLQSVLDEYAHVLVEHLGVSGRPPHEIANDVSGAMRQALTLRTATLSADEVSRAGDGALQVNASLRFRTSYAVRFGGKTQETAQGLARTGDVQKAFNSPFWPFVLCSTSVGQEGLDFHLYCHAIMHWNLPSNPVDLEQREGRVHRFKGHAVRKNVAREFAPRELASSAEAHPDRWRALFDAARRGRADDENDLVPFWVFATKGGDHIERHMPMIPLSKDVARAEALRRSLAVYRMAFGQSRQDDLVAYLQQHLDPAQIAGVMNEFQITLGPPPSSHRSQSGKHPEPGDLGISLEEHGELVPEVGLSTLEDLLDAFAALRARKPQRTVADLEQFLNDFVALAALDPAWRQKWQFSTRTLI